MNRLLRNILGGGLVASLLASCISPSVERPTVYQQQRGASLIDQGTEYLRRAHLKKAKASFEVAYELLDDSAALDGLGCVAFLEGEFLVARDYFLTAIERDETYAESYSHLGLLYDFLGFHREAEVLFHQAVTLQPDNPIMRNNRGVLFQQRKSVKAAREEFYRAYVVFPHKIIHKNITQNKKGELS